MHDIVDFVSKESVIAGKGAAAYCQNLGAEATSEGVSLNPGENVRYIVPQKLVQAEACSLYFRVGCPLGAGRFILRADGEELAAKRFIRAVPGEMEELPISPAVAEKLMRAKDVVLSAEVSR